MSKSSMTYISSGRAKDIFEKPNGDLISEFTDRVPAFDGKKKVEITKRRNNVPGGRMLVQDT